MTKLMIAIPTLCRADLLVRNKEFLESVRVPDEVLILNNGSQSIDIEAPTERAPFNLGVAASWNFFLRRAFIARDFDGLVLLQDDIIWDAKKLECARNLLETRKDVDLFLSYLQFSVQVHRPQNIETIGYYDEQFPGYANDDDYAIRIANTKRCFYERFSVLDPLPGSQIEGTPKPVPGAEAQRALREKWGSVAFEVNVPTAPWYRTNRGAF